MKITIVDNYDSFTFMLVDYIRQHDVDCTVIRNDHPDLLSMVQHADAIVLSPGPQRPDTAGGLLSVIKHQGTQKPLLGVCLGHQAIGEFWGCTLQKASVPMHGKVDYITHTADPLFEGIPNTFQATRYHSLLLTQMTDTISVIATSASNEIMAIRHKQLPVWGIQFHPESCLTEYGNTIIKNFLLAATPKQ